MALLDKLHIQGIRSYSPLDRDHQEVSFMSPITLIMGQNGSGKTTVIESLKYATTGELPPGCDRGKSFVHDPQLVHQSEVQAVVRLRFKDSARQEWTIARYPKVTQKYKKTEFKTTDVALSRVDIHGNKKDFNGRCGEVDVLLCSALGVSKPILENVIFCHQEDSCWPLEEAKKLKEKFDKIFDVSKYNKAMDVVRDLVKKCDNESKELKRNIFHYEDKKKEADDKKRKLREAEQKMESTKNEVENYSRDLERAKSQVQELREKQNEIARLENTALLKNKLMGNLKKQLDEKKSALQDGEFEGSDEALEQALEDFNSKYQERIDTLTKLEKQLKQLQNEETEILNSIKNKQMDMGRLEAQIKHHKDNVVNRKAALHDLAAELNLPNVDQCEDIDVKSVTQQVQRKISAVKSELESLKHKMEIEEQEMQERIDKRREELAKLTQELETKKKQFTGKKSEERLTTRQLAALEHSSDEIQSVESQVVEAETEYNVAESMHKAENWSEKIKDAKENRSRLQDELYQKDNLVKELQRQSETLSEIKYEREQKSKKESEIQKIKNKINTPLTLLFQEVPKMELKKKLTDFLNDKELKQRQKTTSLQAKERELFKMESDCKAQEKKLHEMEEDIQRNEDAVEDLCGSQDLESSLTTIQDEIKLLQTERGTLSSSETMYRHYIKLMQESDPCCPLCHQGFKSSSDVKKLIVELTGKISDVPSRLQENKRRLENLESKQKSLLELKPVFHHCSRLKTTDVPAASSNIKEYKKKLEILRFEIADMNSFITELTTKTKVAKDINNDVVLLDKLETEVKSLDKKIEQLCSKVTGDTSQDLQQVMAEQSALREEVNQAAQEVDDLQDKYNTSKEHLNKLRDQKNKIVEKKLKMQGDLQERKRLEEKKETIEEDLIALQVDMSELSDKLEPAKKKLDSCVDEKSQLKIKNTKLLSAEQSKLTKYQENMGVVSRLTSDIEMFESSGVQNKYFQVRESVEALEKDKERNSLKKQSTSNEIQQLNKYISSGKAQQRELQDNVELRKLKMEEKELGKEIMTLNSELRNINKEQVLKDLQRWEKEGGRLMTHKSHLEGRYKELQDNAKLLRDDLQNPVYRDAEKNLNEKIITIQVKERAGRDLERYWKAIDYAVTHFHQDRMNVINRIIRILWRQIYCGNDIDYIQIKTTSENKMNLKRRSYNYRVVLVRCGVEMDMRGRCSGGQKILASLIIRLALAETFSSKCAFFALDEPTANLDRDNIESFARALGDIVKARVSSPNSKFQLLIITHDQQFLNMLHDLQLLSDYYDVKRDNRGKSIITRKSVSSL